MTDQKELPMSKTYQCPRFNDCNVIVCPLYEHWQKTKLISGRESNCCYYLRKLSQNAPETDSEEGISVFMELVDADVLEILLGRMYQSNS